MVVHIPVDQSWFDCVRPDYSLWVRVAQDSQARVSYSDRMKCQSFWKTIGLLGSIAVACSSPETRPDTIADCDDAACDGVRGNAPIARNLGSGGQSNQMSQDGSAGNAGAGGSGMISSGLSVLQGTVSVVTEPDLRISGSPAVALQLTTSGNGITALKADVDTDGRFRLDGVSSVRPLWVAIGVVGSEATSQYIDTLQPVRTAPGQPVQLRVVQRSVVNDIASQSFQSNPTTPDPERAHAILNVIDGDGDPLQGASLTNSGLSVAYDAGVIYSDILAATSDRGSLVILNVEADPYPGELTTMVFRADGEEFEFQIYLARGSVTLATLELSR